MSDITAPTPDLFPASTSATDTEALFARVDALRPTLKENFRDEIVKSLYAEAESMARRSVRVQGDKSYDLDQRIDRIVTSPIFGLPIMLLMLAAVFWVTIVGANIPSKMLADALFWIGEQGAALFTALGVTVVDHRLHLGWGVPRAGVGRSGDAAADGDLLPDLHHPGRPGLPAARGFQPGLPVQEEPAHTASSR